MISIQEEDFDVAVIQSFLRNEAKGKTGATCIFTGLVREFGDQKNVESIFLEHYAGMTERQLQGIVEQAKIRWPILATAIIHRVGELRLDEQIVAVGVSSPHRRDAFEACAFIMDYLKHDATIWKKEIGETTRWVEAKESDMTQADRWRVKAK